MPESPAIQSPVPPLRRRRPAPAPAPPRWRRLLNALLIFVTVVLVVDALVGDKGFMETLRARRESEAFAGRVRRLRDENARLLEMSDRLRKDPSAVEDIARRELGLVRPGEVLFIIKNTKPTRSVSGDPGTR